MGNKRDIKQFKQACREAGVLDDLIYAASKEFHAAKRRGEVTQHMRYGELVAWMREWRRS